MLKLPPSAQLWGFRFCFVFFFIFVPPSFLLPSLGCVFFSFSFGGFQDFVVTIVVVVVVVVVVGPGDAVVLMAAVVRVSLHLPST